MNDTASLEDSDVLATVFEVARIGMCFITASGTFSKVNPGFCRMVGFRADELIGQPYGLCVPEGVIPAQDRFLAAALADSSKISDEWRIKRRDGSSFDALVSFRPVSQKNGHRFIVVTLTDITECKSFQNELARLIADLEDRVRARTSALEESERKYRSIVDSTQEGFWLVGGWGRALEVNQALCDLLGRSAAELKDIPPDEMCAEPYRGNVRSRLYPRPRKGHGQFEIELTHRDGHNIPVLINTVTHVNDQDEPEFGSAFITDMTRRKQLECSLEQALSERKAVLHSSLVGIAFIRDRHYVWTNKAFEQNMLGYEPGELIGQSSLVAYPSPKLFEDLGPHINRSLIDTGMFEIEERVRRKDGQLVWCLISGRMVDRSDLSKGSIWTIVDISKRKATEVELLESLAREKEASELKSRFVSMTSHEFRTPLAAIMSSTELLSDYGERLPVDEKNELVEVIKTSVRRMTQMLEDILVIGKADAGRLDFQPAPIALDDLLSCIIKDARRTTQTSHPIHLENLLSGRTLRLDPRLLTHILQNLLINAIKYSPEESPVELHVEGSADLIRFVVTDRGIGIPSEDRVTLFTSFHRGSNVGNIAGTGLGLAIVKKAVDLHGGRIAVDSELGRGTRFVVTFPEGRG